MTAVGQFELTHRQRTEPVRIARHDDVVLSEEHKRERAFELQQRFAQGGRQRAFARPCDQVQNHFGVARGLEDRAVAFEFAAQFGSVRDIAVVRDRDFALVAIDRERLSVAR